MLVEGGYVAGEFQESELYLQCLNLGIIGNPGRDDEPPPLSPEELKDACELTLHVEGMWCSACSWLIEKAIGSESGVVATRVSFASDTAKIHYLPQQIGPEQISAQIDRLGYKSVSRDDLREASVRERNSLLARTGIAFFLLMNTMFFSYVLYVGYFDELSAEIQFIVPFVLLGLSTPAVTWCGFPIHRKAWHSLRVGAPTMEVLLTTSILSAFLYSVYALARGLDHFYFDTATALVAILLLGKLIEHSAKHRAAESIHRLYEMLPRKVRIKSNGQQHLASIEQLRVGDLFVVREGEKIPADGCIVTGSTTVDESFLTGEAKPVPKQQGDAVIGSSMNHAGAIEVEATRTHDATMIYSIIRMVEEALERRSPIERTVDRIARFFVPAVLLVALATACVLALNGAGAEQTLLRAITVLVIACPCALGMATPLAIAAGIGYAAERGILIRDGSAVQRAASVNTAVFDKTGTLTEGKFALVEVLPSGKHPNETLRLLASLEQYSNHPIGNAVVAAWDPDTGGLLDARDVRTFGGQGIEGRVGSGTDTRVALGTAAFVKGFGFQVPVQLTSATHMQAEQGNTVVYFGIGDEGDAGALVLGDRLKASARETCKKLQSDGIEVKLVSGDSARTTSAIASEAGIANYVADALPQDKIAIVEQMQSQGDVVAMVGDGVNDAPALAQSDVGIAIGGGTEIAMESSAFTLLRNDLSLVNEALHTAARTVSTVKQNLAWAFLYNVVGMFLAIVGLLNPLIAAVAMLVSSLSVVTNSLRLKAGQGKFKAKLIEFFFPWIEPSANV